VAATWNEYREFTARAPCFHETVFAGRVAVSVAGVTEPGSVQTLNPVSSGEVSCHDQTIPVEVIEVALGVVGAAGGEPAEALVETSRSDIARNDAQQNRGTELDTGKYARTLKGDGAVFAP